MLLLPKVLKTEMGKSITEATIGVRWRRCAEASCQIWGPINFGDRLILAAIGPIAANSSLTV
jgi:hypothetical protein